MVTRRTDNEAIVFYFARFLFFYAYKISLALSIHTAFFLTFFVSFNDKTRTYVTFLLRRDVIFIKIMKILVKISTFSNFNLE